MTGAERMKITGELAKKGDTAAEELAEIFAAKNNIVCGGSEIREELTKGTGLSSMRTNNWDKALSLAEAYIKTADEDIPKFTKRLKELEKKHEVGIRLGKQTGLDEGGSDTDHNGFCQRRFRCRGR
jgi:hypothetical protein